MQTVQIGTTRQWAEMLAVGALLTIAMIVVLAVVLPAAALVFAAAVLAIGAMLVAQRVRTVARTVRASVASEREHSASVPATLLLEQADGTVLQARAVPMPRRSDDTLVLTRAGYMIVTSDGEVLYRL